MGFQSINPTTGKPIRSYPSDSPAGLSQKLERAAAGWSDWATLSMNLRAAPMKRCAQKLRHEKNVLARLMAEEMGKPIAQARAEVEKCAAACDYFAAHAGDLLTPEKLPIDGAQSYVRFDPLGIILAIMPWNFPLWQIVRFAAPALMTGNVALVKPAPITAGCALALEKIFAEAGFPKGVLQIILVGVDRIPQLIADPRIKAVTLTGSDRAGAKVAARAGEHLKKCVLELGGSDPFIIFGDADIKKVAGHAATARTINSGQSCIAAKRFIVEEKIADGFVAALKKNLEEIVAGDPLDPATEMGPLARSDLRENLHGQVTQSISQGAQLITGGQPTPRPGFFYPPTLLDHVRPEMTVACEETFGPVAAVIRVKNEDQAIAVANQTAYGLGASLWTKNIRHAEALAARIEAGSVFINGVVHSDPRLPFGGVKRSGFGRELSAYGIKEFTNIKTVWVGKGR